jgi:hypothetical protein
MKTLTYLNGVADTVITYTDNRDPDVRFSSLNFRTLELNTTSPTFAVQYPVDIVEIIQPTTADVVYTIEFPTTPTVDLTWTSIPAGVTVSTGGNTWIISGIQSVADWDAMKTPIIEVPTEFKGYVPYSASIAYNRTEGRKTWTWEVITFLPEAELEVVASVNAIPLRIRYGEANLYASLSNDQAILNDKVYFNTGVLQQFYVKGVTETLTAPTIISPYSATYSITITPSNTAMVSTIALSSNPGITFSFNGTSKVATMSGTRANMITALANLQITFAAGAISDFTITYAGTTNNTAQINNMDVTLSMLSTEYWSAYYDDPYYSDVTTNYVINSPQITNDSADPSDDITYSYTVTIEPNDKTKVTLLDTTDYESFVLDNTLTFTNSYTYKTATPTRNKLFFANIDPTTSTFEVKEYTLTAGVYNLTQTLTPTGPAGDVDNSYYGTNIVVNDAGTRLIVSAPFYGDVTGPTVGQWGAVYIYTHNGTTWSLEQKIEGSSAVKDQQLGTSISVDTAGTILAVSLRSPDEVRIYTRAGTTWSLIGTISDPASQTLFGTRVRINDAGNKLAITSSTNTYGYTISNYSPFATSLDYTIAGYGGSDLQAIDSTGSKVYINDRVYTNGSLEYTFASTINQISNDGIWVAAGSYYYKYDSGWTLFDGLAASAGTVRWINSSGDQILGQNSTTFRVFNLEDTGKLWDNSLKRLTLTGSKNRVNTMITNLFANINFTDPFGISLNYGVTTPAAATKTRTQLFTVINEIVNTITTSSLTCNAGFREQGAAALSTAATVVANGGELQPLVSSTLTSTATLICNGDKVYPFVLYHNRARRWGNAIPPGLYNITNSSSDNSGSAQLKAPELSGTLTGRYFNAYITVSGGSASDRLTINNFAARATSIWLSEADSLNVAYTASQYTALIDDVQFYETAGSTAGRTLRFEVYEFDYANPNANGDSGIKIYDVTVALTYIASF